MFNGNFFFNVINVKFILKNYFVDNIEYIMFWVNEIFNFFYVNVVLIFFV